MKKILLMILLITLLLGCSKEPVAEESDNCTALVLDKYNLTNDENDIKVLTYLMMLTAQGDSVEEYLHNNNISERAALAFIDILDCILS